MTTRGRLVLVGANDGPGTTLRRIMNVKDLVDDILGGYQLPIDGIHGFQHWARVLENSMRLAEATNAKVEVVTLFALFHDSRRVNEDDDPGHGRRGAELAAAMRGTHFDLSDEDFDLLDTACTYHTAGLTKGDITVQTCWDADRLDLARVGISPAPRYLCTGAAKSPHMMRWATERALAGFVPEIARDWGIRRRRVHG